MANLNPKLAPTDPTQPFKDGQDWNQSGETALQRQRRESGGLPDSSTEESARVKDTQPYRNLRNG